MLLRSSFRSLLQPGRSIPLQVFAAGLAANPELLAQLRDRETVALREHDETNDLFHGGDLVPRRSLKVSPITLDQVLPITPDHTINQGRVDASDPDKPGQATRHGPAPRAFLVDFINATNITIFLNVLKV